MTLEDAFLYIIKEKGVEAIAEPDFIDNLIDIKAFGSPAERRIVSTMCECGHLVALQQKGVYDSSVTFDDIKRSLVDEEGFQSDLVEYVVGCLQHAINKSEYASACPNVIDENDDIIKVKTQASKQEGLYSTREGDRYLVTLNNQSYILDETAYRAIMRKKDMPTDRLEVWIRSYADEVKRNNC